MVVTCAKVYVKIFSPTNDLLEDRILSVRMQGNSRNGIQTSMDLMRKCKSVELSSVFQKEICGVLDAGLKNNVLKCEKQVDSFLDHEMNCLFVSSQNGVTVKMGTLQLKHNEVLFPTSLNCCCVQSTEGQYNISLNFIFPPLQSAKGMQNSSSGYYSISNCLQQGNRVRHLERYDQMFSNMNETSSENSTSYRDCRYFTKKLHYQEIGQHFIKVNGFSAWKKKDVCTMWESQVGSDQNTKFVSFFMYFH